MSVLERRVGSVLLARRWGFVYEEGFVIARVMPHYEGCMSFVPGG